MNMFRISRKLILIILSIIIFGLVRLFFRFYIVSEADFKDFLINLIAEIIGIIIVIFAVDYVLFLERKYRWKKINNPYSKIILLRIQQYILTTLHQFGCIDFYKSQVADLSKMKGMLESFLNKDFDKFITDKITNLNKDNIVFLKNLLNWLTNCASSISKLLEGIKPYCKPEIEKKIKSIQSFTWFVARSLSNNGKIVLPKLSQCIDIREASRIQPDLKIDYTAETFKDDTKEFKRQLKQAITYLIILYNFAEKNNLFYIVE